MTTGIVILAAGSGSRLGTKIPKPLVPFLGIPMLQYTLDILPNLPYFIIISPQHTSLFKKTLGNHPYLFQKEPLGTGHAISSQYKTLATFKSLIILNADSPLITKELLNKLIAHPSKNTLVAFRTQNTQDYGQIETKHNKAINITESKDRSKHLSNLCYSGIMKISQASLKTTLSLQPSNTTKEYYLTKLINPNNPFDIIEHSQDELHGINTPKELLHCESLYKERQYINLLEQNTFLSDYNTLSLYKSTLGQHNTLESHITLKNSHIGNHCHIGQGSILNNVTLLDHCTILPYSILSNCKVDNHSTIGPFAHIQENTLIGKHTHIGNFVEIKRSILKDHVKAKHLSYLGDAYIDTKANIGAGTITCNYVPWRKEKSLTYIGPYSLIGANTLLIAPCHIGAYSFTAAGSVIQNTLPPKHLAITRAPLTVQYFSKLVL